MPESGSKIDFTINPESPDTADKTKKDTLKKVYEEFLRKEGARPQLQEVVIENEPPKKRRKKARKEDLPN
jgi:hypothetical protein